MFIPAWIFLSKPAAAPTARQYSPFLARGFCDLSWHSGHVLLMLTLTFTAQPHWHPDSPLPIPSEARKPRGYARTIQFGDMH